MRFVSAVALAVAMLWVPVDGVAQTQVEREMLELYESRERELLASMDPEADRLQMESHSLGCLRLVFTGGPGDMSQEECLAAGRELGDRLAARRNSVQQELFALRQDKLELIRLARASTNPPQPEVQGTAGARVTAGAGATGACSMLPVSLGVLRSRAEQGDAAAQAELGSLYGQGNCVPQDHAEAVRLFRLAADQGDALAQVNLGLMYANGEVVPEDYVLSYMWFNLAAAQGNESAQSNKDSLEQGMTREQIAEAQRLSREWLEAQDRGGN